MGAAALGIALGAWLLVVSGAPGEPPAPLSVRAAAPRVMPEPFLESFSTLDPSRWQCAGWESGNTRFVQSDEYARVENGRLVLEHKKAEGENQYRSGMVYSRGYFHYGTYTARMKAPDVHGLLCSFFVYMKDEAGGVHEVDIELLTRLTGFVRVTTYKDWRPDLPPAEHRRRMHACGHTPAGLDIRNWNDYTFRWDAGGVEFFVNNDHLGSWSDVVPYKAAQIFFGLNTVVCDETDTACKNDIGGPPSADHARLEVDWLKVEPRLTVHLDRERYGPGERFDVWVSFQEMELDWDGYVVIRGMGRAWSVTKAGLREGIHPLAVGMFQRPRPYSARVLSMRVPGGIRGPFAVWAALVPTGQRPNLDGTREMWQQLAVTEFEIAD
ncbi:MAG: glycoside hydrolase family 16 protein [bacterium]|nr:glycoside hydrolase family 16 protein [bacterium]